MSSVLWHVGIVVGLLGFGICAARSVCQRDHGTRKAQDEQAVRAMTFLVVAILCGVAAWGW